MFTALNSPHITAHVLHSMYYTVQIVQESGVVKKQRYFLIECSLTLYAMSSWILGLPVASSAYKRFRMDPLNLGSNTTEGSARLDSLVEYHEGRPPT